MRHGLFSYRDSFFIFPGKQVLRAGCLACRIQQPASPRKTQLRSPQTFRPEQARLLTVARRKYIINDFFSRVLVYAYRQRAFIGQNLPSESQGCQECLDGYLVVACALASRSHPCFKKTTAEGFPPTD